jgi:hypothetical protein
LRSCQLVSKARLFMKTRAPGSDGVVVGARGGGARGSAGTGTPAPRTCGGAGRPGSAASRSSRTKIARECSTESCSVLMAFAASRAVEKVTRPQPLERPSAL